jgi:hypothetical protein
MKGLAIMLLALAAPALAADEKPSRLDKEADNLGRAFDSIGRRIGDAADRTGKNVWIKKKAPKKAEKKAD